MTTTMRNAAAYRLGWLASGRRPQRVIRADPITIVSLRMLFGGEWLRLFRQGYRDGRRR